MVNREYPPELPQGGFGATVSLSLEKGGICMRFSKKELRVAWRLFTTRFNQKFSREWSYLYELADMISLDVNACNQSPNVKALLIAFMLKFDHFHTVKLYECTHSCGIPEKLNSSCAVARILLKQYGGNLG